MPDGCERESKCLTREDAQLIVRETLVALGVDINNPIEFQADARFVRKMRTTHERVGAKALLTIVGLFITGTAALIVLGAVAFVKGKAG